MVNYSLASDKDYGDLANFRVMLDEELLRSPSSKLNRILKYYVQNTLDKYDRKYHGDRKGNWTPTRSGKRFYPEDPRPGDFDIVDIAHCLSVIPRFCGHTYEPYSIAQHSVMVSNLVDPEFALFGLMHDASEAYIHDIITPIKKLLSLSYNPLEERLMSALSLQYGFAMDAAGVAAVKKADLTLLATEVRDLLPCGYLQFSIPNLPLSSRLEATPWPQAKQGFVTRFKELTDGRGTE